MGTPVIGGDITGAVTDDSGALVTGDLDDIGFGTGNADDTYTIISSASYGTATINPTTGAWSYDLDDDHPVVNALGAGDTMEDVFTVRMDDATQGSDTQVVTITITGVVCFAAGTLIDTDRGPRPVESLGEGDLVRTLDHGVQTVRWASGRVLDRAMLTRLPNLCPVEIAAGALGPDCPARRLVVSPQHRVLIASRLAERVFGAAQVLVPAVMLVGWPGITRFFPQGGQAYHHLLFDRHEILMADGAPAESLFCGPEALKSLGAEAVSEIASRVPAVGFGAGPAMPARRLPESGRQVRAFLARLRRQGKPLLDPAYIEGAEGLSALAAE